VSGADQNIEQRPYRGMQQFSEQHKDLFFGRLKPVDEIFDLLKNNLLTVIFGKSGIGKSSLINAGLLPKLRENFYLPVLIRIPFSDARVDPLNYTRACIEAEVKKYIFKGFYLS
jgi:AAA+ ATPase superfamily predicted ATPase